MAHIDTQNDAIFWKDVHFPKHHLLKGQLLLCWRENVFFNLHTKLPKDDVSHKN